MLFRTLLLLSLLAPAVAAWADTPRATRDPDPEVLSSEGFLNAHPDMKWRAYGVREWAQGRPERAYTYFRRAARYADKPSQAMVAEMYWTGEGVEQDRALGYAWMDLAAERGYQGFLVLRERYWSELDEAGRERALAEGVAIYDEYEDRVAKPRMERVLRRERSRMTGTRTGFGGLALQVEIPGPGGLPILIDGSRFYDPQYWEAERYWEWQDEVWEAPARGRVDVGELEQIRDTDPPDGD